MKIGKWLLLLAAVTYVAAVLLTMAEQKTASYVAYLVASASLVIGWSRYKRENDD